MYLRSPFAVFNCEVNIEWRITSNNRAMLSRWRLTWPVMQSDFQNRSKSGNRQCSGCCSGYVIESTVNEKGSMWNSGKLVSDYVLLVCYPTMIWEAVQNVVATVSATVEDAQEAYEDNIYYVFYGSTDGHGGADALSGIIQVI